MKRISPPIIFLLLLLAANTARFFSPLNPAAAIALTLVFPGWGWALWIFPRQRWLPRAVLALALSYTITALGTLALQYLPGGITEWQMLALLNVAAIVPFLHPQTRHAEIHPPSLKITAATVGFVAVLLLAVGLRFADLGYSEFQGDESLAMISAAETIRGHADALFLRGKGPAEILLPAAVWTLTGTVTEGIARVPFAFAGVMVLLSFYLLAKDIFSARAARYATAIFAAAGLMVGFSRIVQYQTIVVWMSILALWTFWRWHKTAKMRWAILSGLFLGIGLLAHYDAVLVTPAIGWVWLVSVRKSPKRHFIAAINWVLTAIAAAAIFYLPYLLDPQIARTGDYVSGRIGAGVKNHLLDFLHFNAFYSSFYFVLVAGLLLTVFFGWALFQLKEGKWWTIFGVTTLLMLAITPNWLGDWTFAPFAAIFLLAFISPALDTAKRAALIWFAVPFLGYNFAVATPLTHIYTTLPGWALLAGWTAGRFAPKIRTQWVVNTVLVLLSSLYLWNAFVRHDVEFLQDYPTANLDIFWTPYPTLPQTGFFGFAHRAGWKAVGALVADGTLAGDYRSNEEPDVTSWYTRQTPRACDPGAEFFFAAEDVVDAGDPLPGDGYTEVGSIATIGGKTLTISQRTPATLKLGAVDEISLAQQFNRSAVPAVFAREPHIQTPTDINFGGKIRLVGYTLNTSRAYPTGRLWVVLFWEIGYSLRENYKVFVHLDSEKKYAQADSVPVCGRYPTEAWRAGQIIADMHAMEISPDTPLTDLPLVVGLYQPETGMRLDVLDVAGNPAGVSATIATVKIHSAP